MTAACSSTTSNGGGGGASTGGASGAGPTGGSAGTTAGGAGGGGGASGSGGTSGGGGTTDGGGVDAGGGVDGGGGTYCGPSGVVKGAVCQLGVVQTGEKPVAIAIDSTHVWYATTKQVRRVPKDASAVPSDVSAPVIGTYKVGGLSFDGPRICWSEEDGSLPNGFIRCRPSSLSSNPAALVSGELRPRHMTAEGQFLFWMNDSVNGDGGVRKIPTGGTAGVGNLVAQISINAIAADQSDDFLYFVPVNDIRRVKKGGGTPETVLANATWSSPRLLALSPNDVYYAAPDGVRRTTRKAGAPPSTLTAAVTGNTITALLVRGDMIYWALTDNSLWHEPLLTNGEQPLPTLGTARALAADSESIYWISDGFVAKTKLP